MTVELCLNTKARIGNTRHRRERGYIRCRQPVPFSPRAAL